MKSLTLLLLCAFTSVYARAQEPAFSLDSAYANLSFIAGDIGPRPMGSPAERRALAYAVERFASFGCEEAYVMPMMAADGVNTNSGIAVGIKKGKTGRAILIGGHMDSVGPDIPGANDDGSGAASVIELARVLSKRENQSTLIFCCWGGEEEGLRGSTYFAEHFAGLDSIALMLQIDMADGSGVLEVDPDGANQQSAPRWLVEAAFDVFYRELPYRGLYYATQMATLNSSGKGITGSDHMPFLEKGIPAVDFTSDVGYPIHTPLDNLQNFDKSGLKRSGDLVLKLVERFDGGVPSRSIDQYYLFNIGATPIFISHTLLWIFLVVVCLGTVAAIVVAWKKRVRLEKQERIRFSGVKLLLYLVVVQTFIWVSPRIVAILSGHRFPWVNNFGGFVVLSLVAGMAGVWLSMRWALALRLSRDPYPYYIRAFVFLLVFAAALLLLNIEMTVYALVPLFLLLCAMAVRARWAKAVFLLFSPYLPVKMVFFEGLGILQRGLAQQTLDRVWQIALYDAAFVLLFTLLSLPFVYAAAAVFSELRLNLAVTRWFRTWQGIATTGVAFAAFAIILANRPVYDRLWEEEVRARQRYVMGRDSSEITIVDAEWLRGTRLQYDGKDTLLAGKNIEFVLQPAQRSAVTWLSIETTNEEKPSEQSDNAARAVERRLVLHSTVRPLTVTIRYRSSSPLAVESPWVAGGRRTKGFSSPYAKAYSWYAFPDTPLVVPLKFTLQPGESIAEEIEVTYDSLAYPIAITKPLSYVTRRTVVIRQDTLRIAKSDENLAERQP